VAGVRGPQPPSRASSHFPVLRGDGLKLEIWLMDTAFRYGGVDAWQDWAEQRLSRVLSVVGGQSGQTTGCKTQKYYARPEITVMTAHGAEPKPALDAAWPHIDSRSMGLRVLIWWSRSDGKMKSARQMLASGGRGALSRALDATS
jgi:hypothetical protein